ncbi:MAG: DNA polymerase III subunit beta [Tissierellia bacterium]|nr:DNA polymerase III subunit beta [Tissierellia bacterium]MDD4725686.1 DNA polymerase III subunit beta [Tissierellia bacterium]
MKFVINQKDLSKHINIAQKGISTRTTLQILDGILLEANDNKIKLTSTDLEISIVTFVDCQVIENGSIVVNSRIFGDIIRKLPDAPVHINVKNNKINIICENSEFNIIGNLGEDYPDLPVVEEEKDFILNKDLLKNAIRQTVFATTQDETRPTLTGVLLEINNNEISFVSLDGYRLALKKVNTDSNNEISIIIPGRSLNELNKIIDDGEDDIKISITSSQILFNIGDTIFYSRLLEGQFFNYKDIMRKEHKTKVTVNKRDLQNSLERASLLAKEEKANLIRLNVMDNNIVIRSNTEIGDVYEKVDSIQDGEDLNIAFNSKYILEGIKIMDVDEIDLNFMGSLNPCIINGVDDENYTYLVLPVRLAHDDF